MTATTLLVHAPDTGRAPAVDDLVRLADEARGYVASAKAPETLRAYRTDWRAFTAWCDQRGLDALPAAPETLALYLADVAGVLAVGSIQRRLTSISQAHKAAGHPSPTTAELVRLTWRGIRRTFGAAPNKKQALETPAIRDMVAALDDERLIDQRDRALVLLGFGAALRRSELAALDVEDIEVTTEGLLVTIRRSKTDQEAQGVTLGVPFGSNPATCPVRAFQAWLAVSGITSGAVFRRVTRHGRLLDGRMSGRACAERIKLRAGAVGHDPARIGGHSVRRGFITSAARAKVHERDIMRHSRHRSVVVLRGYIEDATVWDDNAAMAVGL